MNLADTIDAVRPSVVQITYTVFDLPEDELQRLGVRHVLSRPLGTGFFVNDEAYIVTAQHVVEGMRTLDSTFPLGRVTVGVGLAYANTDFMRSNFNVIGFDVVDEDHRHDLALLKMRANPFQGEVGGGIVIGDKPLEPLHGVPVLRLDRPRDGEAIAVSGYPLSETVMVTNQGVIASSWSVEVDDIPHPTLPGLTSPEIRDLYLGDVQSNPGNSGGPVYATEDGAFVGVLVAGRLTSVQTGSGPASIAGVPLYHDAGLSLIVPTKYVTEMLDRNGVKWDSGS